jgi:catechol 2,3-dioxygenase-like lactoylglutathione lyase family enzyme
MENPLLRFHHFGLAVRRPDKAFAYLKSLGYTEGYQTYDPLQFVNLAMWHHETMPDVEVIWPGEVPSPIDNLVKGGKSLIYHLCYVTEQVDQALAGLRNAGLQVVEITPPKPALLFGGVPVSFHNVLGVGLIEIIHGEPRASC